MDEAKTAVELGLTNAQLYKLEAAGKAARSGKRKAPGRGRPAVLWLVNESAIRDANSGHTGSGLENARAARSQAASDRTWEYITKYKDEQGCTCDLRPGMSWDDLLPLGSGCTPKWVCPVLDCYRRQIGGPPTRNEGEVDLA